MIYLFIYFYYFFLIGWINPLKFARNLITQACIQLKHNFSESKIEFRNTGKPMVLMMNWAPNGTLTFFHDVNKSLLFVASHESLLSSTASHESAFICLLQSKYKTKNLSAYLQKHSTNFLLGIFVAEASNEVQWCMNTRSQGEADIKKKWNLAWCNNFRCSEKKNSSWRLNERVTVSGTMWSIRKFTLLSTLLLANVSLKGYNVYCCLAAPSAALGHVSHWLLWSGSESIDAIIQNLSGGFNSKHVWYYWNYWTCIPLTSPDNLGRTACYERELNRLDLNLLSIEASSRKPWESQFLWWTTNISIVAINNLMMQIDSTSDRNDVCCTTLKNKLTTSFNLWDCSWKLGTTPPYGESTWDCGPHLECVFSSNLPATLKNIHPILPEKKNNTA